MKIASLSLKIIAILAAAFAVYAWIDTRGTISTAETQMKDVPGLTLAEKAPKVPGILKDNADKQKSIDALKGRISGLEKRNQEVNSELESERSKSVQANADIVKKNAEIRTLNSTLATANKSVAEKDTTIENLKREIVSAKSMMTQSNEGDVLKEKVATLESQLSTKTTALEEAEKKIKALETAEYVTVTETDENGKEVVKKIMKLPYEAKGDIATVLSVDHKKAMVVLNRGDKDGLKRFQKVVLKREGVVVAEVAILDTKEDLAVAHINQKSGIPETLEIGDLLELTIPAVASTPVAPASNGEAAPAAPAATESVETPAPAPAATDA